MPKRDSMLLQHVKVIGDTMSSAGAELVGYYQGLRRESRGLQRLHTQL